VTRLIGWLCLIAIALAGRYFDNAVLGAACLPALLLLLALNAPVSLRWTLGMVAATGAIAIAAGFAEQALDAIPALIAALVGWLFARTLSGGRTPLIARAIAAMDGAEQLADSAIAHYARRLTQIWALYQGLLALVALLLALRIWYWPQYLAALPGPRLFGAVVLPLAVAGLAFGEFLLRPALLPQAPRRSFWSFARDLIRTWPSILDDGPR
jgi:uncharacterized membrane protein